MVNQLVLDELFLRWPENKINPSLDRIKLLLDHLGNPQNGPKAIHVAGTNGKTSTSRMIERLFHSLDLRTGLYTSPHLIHPHERISIDGKPISENLFIETYENVKPFLNLIEGDNTSSPLTFFEVLTAMAFVVFADTPVDVISLEVGMGGKWDATNVLIPEVSVITPIDFDHQEYLGNTIELIAAEKTGIIKEQIPVVVTNQRKEAAKVILEKALEMNATVFREEIEFAVLDRTMGLGGQQLTIATPFGKHEELFLPLYGSHQASNAAAALTAIEVFFDRQIEDQIVRDTFAEFSSPGRMEVLKRNPTIVVDAAHNPAGVKTTKAALKESFNFDNLILILAVMKDKDVKDMLNELSGIANTIIITKTQSERAMPVEELIEMAKKIPNFSNQVLSASDSKEALDLALDLARNSNGSAGVVGLGSVVLAGELTSYLKGKQ